MLWRFFGQYQWSGCWEFLPASRQGTWSIPHQSEARYGTAYTPIPRSDFGAGRIELPLQAPHARVLPLYYAPIDIFHSPKSASGPCMRTYLIGRSPKRRLPVYDSPSCLLFCYCTIKMRKNKGGWNKPNPQKQAITRRYLADLPKSSSARTISSSLNIPSEYSNT